MPKIAQPISARRIVVLRVLAAILLVGAAYLGFLWFQLGSYLSAADSATRTATEAVTILNKQITEFRGDPPSAEKVRPKLGKSVVALREAASVIANLDAPPGAASYEASLTALYQSTTEYARGLEMQAVYVTARGKAVTEFATGVDAFRGQIPKAGGDAKVLVLADGLRRQTDRSLATLRSISSTGTYTYTNEVLDAYMTGLSQSLGRLRAGLTTQDADEVVSAANAMGAVLGQDWRPALFAADKVGSNKLRGAARSLQTQSVALQGVRADLDRTRSVYPILAALLLVVAGFFVAASVRS